MSSNINPQNIHSIATKFKGKFSKAFMLRIYNVGVVSNTNGYKNSKIR